MFLYSKVLLYAPFYITATYAFIRQRIWIQPWCLLWAGAVLGSSAPVFIENFYGSLAAEPWLYLSINGLPVMVRRMICM